MIKTLALVLLCFVLSFNTAHSATEKRVALVIGNSTYSHVSRLKNPRNDAEDIGEALSRIGFQVTIAIDVGYREMGKALSQFSREAQEAETALIYYAGHGVEVGGRNYLLPVDAEVTHTLDLDFQAFNLQSLLRGVEGAEKLSLVFLDACRDNPFGTRYAAATRSIGRGLGEIEPPRGVVVSYAARGGTVAFDGDGENSPYATALLEHLETPGLEVGKLFRKVRDAVLKATGGRQEPFTYGSLSSGDIFLAGQRLPSNAVSDFAAAQSLETVEAWDGFIERYETDEGQAALVLAARRLRDALAPKTELGTTLDTFEFRLPATTPEAAESALKLSRDELSQVQELLNAIGYSVGAADGVFGRKSRAALKKFQQAELLDPTGYLDQRVLAALTAVFEESPQTYDGEWELSLMRAGRAGEGGHDFAGRTDTMAIIRLEILGRRVEVKSVSDMTSAPGVAPIALRASLTESGRLELSYVLNYEFFKKATANRTGAAITLPKRVRYDHVLEANGGRLSAKYRSRVSLRRLDPNRQKQIWE